MSTMTMPGLRGGLDETMEALERAAIVAKFDFTREDRGCVAVEVSKAQRRRALQLSAAALRRSGYRVCCDETSVYAFPVAGGRGVMLEFGQRSRRRVAPHFALVGPDGVGKSTVLRLIRERIASEAPFLETTFRQWRPGLVPSLASLAGKPEANEGEPSAFRPKRDPGNLQWLRLGYYGLDYLAGPRWKHREESRPRLIIYDRCALDMLVDPYRFSLRSRRGTRTLWSLIPKPAGIILLHDRADRIAARKDDLTFEEIREQSGIWLELVREGMVSSVVQVEDRAVETANRVYQALIDQFLACYEQSVAAESGCALPVEGRGEEYAVFPSKSDARVLIPVRGSVGLDLYSAQRPLARAAKSLLRAGLATGIASRVWPHRVQLDTRDLAERFTDLLGEKVRLAFSPGRGNARQRSIVQVASAHGKVLAYAKAGFDESSRGALRREEATLRSLEAAGFTREDAPRVLGSFAWRDAWVLAETAGPKQPGAAHRLTEAHAGYAAKLARTFAGTAPAAKFADLEKLGFAYYGHLVAWAEDFLRGAGPLPGAFVHGDFTPWNLSVGDGRVFAFDWEQAFYPGPAGWDLFHFVIATAIEVQGHSPATILAELQSNAMIARYFETAGIDAALFRPLLVRYLAGALTHSVAADATGVDAKEEAMRRAWAFLLVAMRYDEVRR